ncbi:hypothetical protein CHU98_g676 [Xylaria longipes]|nr:hypothetical protein CHU98_g676 [Xylaria longipes]
MAGRNRTLQHKNQDELNSLRIPLLEEEERFKARRLLMSQRPELDPESTSSGSSQEERGDQGGDQRGESEGLDIPMGDYDYGMGDDDGMLFMDSDGSQPDPRWSSGFCERLTELLRPVAPTWVC